MPTPVVEVIVDSRLRIAQPSKEFERELRTAFSYANPEYSKRRSLGRWTGGVSTRVSTWRSDGAELSLPRGGAAKLREVAERCGVRLLWRDHRVSVRPDVPWPKYLGEERPYQLDATEACAAREQGIVRGKTGSGKTDIALRALGALEQRSLVMVRSVPLLEQWVERACVRFGMRESEIGTVRGGRRPTIGEHLTVAVHQALSSPKFRFKSFAKNFGAVVLDEVHTSGAKTIGETIDAIPARVRLGFSDDETRNDRLDFLVYDAFGEVLYETDEAALERDGYVCPVIVRLVPTEFEAPWYRNAEPSDRDFTRLLAEMTTDADRNLVLRRLIGDLVRSGQQPALVFSHRIEHAQNLAMRDLAADKIPVGLMLGGTGNKTVFAETKQAIREGRLRVGVGTYGAIGQGIDVPNVLSGIAATPIGSNRQFFRQARGRVCRPAAGKSVGYFYYLWDREVFPNTPRNLIAWNDGRVEMLDGGAWVPYQNERRRR